MALLWMCCGCGVTSVAVVQLVWLWCESYGSVVDVM